MAWRANGPIGIFLWKMKFFLLALATKGKLLLLGLTKRAPSSPCLLRSACTGPAWGMWFAAGLVLSIYVHEMGHVAALRRFGLSASAPMFIPGFGALFVFAPSALLRTRRADRPRGTDVGAWCGDRLSRIARAGGGAMLRRRARRRLDQSLQSAPGVAARWEPRL